MLFKKLLRILKEIFILKSKIKICGSPVWGLTVGMVPDLAGAENCSFSRKLTYGSICVCFSKAEMF